MLPALRWFVWAAALWVSASLGGCARPDYIETRAACGLEAGEHRVFEVAQDGTWEQDISEPCAAALGDAIGLDWQSFGESGPRVIRARDVGEELGMVVSGLLLLASLDLGPGDPAALRGAPPILRDAVQRIRPLRPEGASLGELIFTVVQAAISRVTLTQPERISHWGRARWTPRHRMWVADYDDPGSEAGNGMEILIHEALHREVYHDLDCAVIDELEAGEYSGEKRPKMIGLCDRDDQGVNGATAWVFRRLMDRLGVQPGDRGAAAELAWSAYGAISVSCGGVCEIDPDGPCWIIAESRARSDTVCDLSTGYFGGR